MARNLPSILLENKLVTEEQLKQISHYADAVGIALYEAVLQKKIAPPESVMMAYAESIGLPFVHLADTPVDEHVIAQVDPITARQHSFLPVSIDKGYLLLAVAKPVIPDVEEELRMIFGMPVRCAICLPSELHAAISRYYQRDASRIEHTSAGAAKVPTPPKEQPKKPQKKPLTDAEKNDRLLKTIVAFNTMFAAITLSCNFLHFPKGLHNSLYQFPVLAFFGAVGGGLAAYWMWRRSS